MASMFGVRAFFPGANGGLRQFFGRYNLSPPVGLRGLAANAAIAQEYQRSGNYSGPFGVALSPVVPDTGRSFVQSYEGGKLHFTDDGQVNASDQSFVTISYQGAYSFGSPKFPKSHSLYLIVIVYVANKKSQATVVKIPDDQGGATYDGWDADSEQTGGQVIIFGGSQTDAPTDIVTETLVMGHEPFGDPKSVKQSIHDAVQKEADDAAAAEGVPPDSIPPVVINVLTEGLFAVVDSVLGLTDQVRGKPVSRTFKYADWFNLPAADSLKFHDITYNWETEIMTDGDASYKAYFNLVKHTITS